MAGSVSQTEQLVASILLQLIAMIAAARIGNALFRRMGQPGVIGEIVVGLALGPSLFGYFFPGASVALFGSTASPVITILSQMGLVLLMFQIGASFEFGQLDVPRLRRATLAIAAASIAVPFALGVLVGRLSAEALAPAIDRTVYSLFCGVALAITAMPIMGRILVEFRLEKSEIGVVAISAAAVNDVVGWLLLAFLSAFATAKLTGAGIALTLAELAIFIMLLRWPLGPLVAWAIRRVPLRDGAIAPNLLGLLLCITFTLAIATFAIGVFAIFGGFAAGLLIHRHHDVAEAWRKQIGPFVLVFFLPIFFTSTGLRTNILGMGQGGFSWLALVLALAIVGKIVPVFLAARASGFGARDAGLLGALMNTRGLMELIVLNVGRELGFLPPSMFTMLVVMAVVTTLVTGPLLTMLLPKGGPARVDG